MGYKFNPLTGNLDYYESGSGGLTSPVAVADGGTGATTAADARTNLGLGALAVLGSVDISANTNLAVTSPIILTGDTISINQALLAITASQVSDFDTEVGNNTDVAANTAARHAALTLGTNTATALSLVGQQLSIADVFLQIAGDTMTGALLIDGSADATQLTVQGNATQTIALFIIENSAGTDQILMNVSGGAIFNEQGNDADFRVESDTNTHMLFVDASANKVGIGTSTPDQELSVIGSFDVADADTATKGYRFRTNGSNLDVEGSGADLFFSVWSGANYTGTQRYKFRMESGAEILKIIGDIQVVDGPFGGTHHLISGATNGDAVFNEDGQADADFRVESDSDTHLIFGDASTNRVGIGTNAPGHKLDVADDTANYSFRIINSNIDGFGAYIYINNTDNDKFGLAVESATGTILNVRNDGRVGVGTNTPNEVLEVVGNVRADGLRLDITPTAETPTMTHTITVSLNGTNYKIPVVAA